MAAMDFRGAVLRGWRLLVLLGLLGAVVGYFSVPTTPGPVVTGPSAYEAVSVIAPATGKGSLSLGQLFLDVRDYRVLALAAQKANVGVSAQELSHQVGVFDGRSALGLTKKLLRGVKVKALGISVVEYTPTAAVVMVNSLAQAVGSFINNQAQANYSAELVSAGKVVSNLQTQVNIVNSEITGTAPGDTSLTLLTTQKRVLATELSVAVSKQLQLTIYGPKVPVYTVLRQASVASHLGGGISVASVVGHRSTRVLGGLAVGLVIAVGIILLVEVLDRSLRTVRGTEEAFDLPVVGEIPARGGVRVARQNTAFDVRLEVVVDPGSTTAEAYRRLHTAVLLEPLAAEMALFGNGNGNGNGYALGNGNGYGNGHGNGNGNGNGNGHGNGQKNGNGNGNGHGKKNGNGNGNGGEHGATNGGSVQPANGGEAGNGGGLVYEGNGRSPRRQVILVVSPGAESMRSVVVANLAAVYAEAGSQALVVTLGNLQWGRASTSVGPPLDPEGEFDPEDLAPLSTPSAVEGVSRLQFDQVLASRGQVVTQGPAIVTAARQVADAVLIDAPSLLRSHDAIALLPAVDVVLIVAQYAVTRSDEAREAGDMLRRFRAPVLGVALTNIPGRAGGKRLDDSDPTDNPTGVALEGYDVPRPQSAPTARLWL